jgi:hypothetical protein
MGRAALLKRVGHYPNPHERYAVRIAKHGAEFVVARGLGAAAGFYRTGKVEGMFPRMAGVQTNVSCDAGWHRWNVLYSGDEICLK